MAEPTYADLTQTGAEIQAILDAAVVTSGESSAPSVKVAIVSVLPETPDASTLYFVVS